jgi:hypothetical protein
VGTAGGQGFIYHGGTWARVAFPNSGGGGSINGTQLLGISNNNLIVGQAGSSPPTSFLYTNGVFKIILLHSKRPLYVPRPVRATIHLP